MRIELDEHGQPPLQFNLKRNQEKAFLDLLGFVKGLVADRQLLEIEVHALDAWLRSNGQWLREDPDYVDLFDLTTDILEDGVVTTEEIADLKSLIYIIGEFRGVDYQDLDEASIHLVGLARGITADTILQDAEILALREWLHRSKQFRAQWPLNQLYRKVENVLADGVVTEDERTHLYQTLTDLVGGNLLDDGAITGQSTRLPVEDVDNIEFDNRSFCFTGRFICGPRRSCVHEVVSRGGIPQMRVRRDLDYLVVGGLASRDWINTSYGRKIQQAIDYKRDGCKVMVISEQNWLSNL